MIEAVLVMMNNYFHDLGVAFLFASSWLSWLVVRHWPGTPSPRVARLLVRVAWGSFAWVLVGGAVRAWFYMDYEWLPEAGTAQIPALGIKHALLGTVTVLGLVGVVKLHRAVRQAGG